MSFTKYYSHYMKYLQDNAMDSVKVTVIVPMNFEEKPLDVELNKQFEEKHMLIYLQCFNLLYKKYKDGMHKVWDIKVSKEMYNELKKANLVVGFKN